MTKLFEEFWR